MTPDDIPEADKMTGPPGFDDVCLGLVSDVEPPVTESPETILKRTKIQEQARRNRVREPLADAGRRDRA